LRRGVFITFEGGEGSGKSTQASRLRNHLAANNHHVVITREPGGTPQGEALRTLLVSGDIGQWSAASEAMLMSAAREAHVRTVIRPALVLGHTVISDRFMDSTRVYQGFAGGADLDLLAALEQAAVGDCTPDLTLICDLSPVLGLARAKARGTANEDRFERKGLAFHDRLRQGFHALAKAEPHRCKVVDASLPEDRVFAQIVSLVEAVVQHG
jgi:dTMP kinase